MKYSNTFTLALILCFSVDYIAISVLNVPFFSKAITEQERESKQQGVYCKRARKNSFSLNYTPDSLFGANTYTWSHTEHRIS